MCALFFALAVGIHLPPLSDPEQRPTHGAHQGAVHHLHRHVGTVFPRDGGCTRYRGGVRRDEVCGVKLGPAGVVVAVWGGQAGTEGDSQGTRRNDTFLFPFRALFLSAKVHPLCSISP